MNTREDILKNDLIDFIKENNIDINNNKNSQEKKKLYYQENFKQLSKEKKKEIADVLDNIKIFEIDDCPNQDTMKLYMILFTFKIYLIQQLTPEKKIDYKKIGKLERHPNPSLEVYKNIDRNNITYSKQAY